MGNNGDQQKYQDNNSMSNDIKQSKEEDIDTKMEEKGLNDIEQNTNKNNYHTLLLLKLMKIPKKKSSGPTLPETLKQLPQK